MAQRWACGCSEEDGVLTKCVPVVPFKEYKAHEAANLREGDVCFREQQARAKADAEAVAAAKAKADAEAQAQAEAEKQKAEESATKEATDGVHS